MRFDAHSRFHFLSAAEMECIHERSLRILSEVGMRFPDREILDKLHAHGCLVDFSTSTVKMPEEAVERSLGESRGSRQMPGGGGEGKGTGNPKESWMIRGTVSGFVPNALDRRTDLVRGATKSDLFEAIAIANSLDCVETCGSLFSPGDVPIGTEDLHQLALHLKHSRKPGFINLLYPRSFEYALQLGLIAYGSEQTVRDRGVLDYHCFVSSPLQFTAEALRMARIALRMGGKTSFGTPMAVMGATAPVTLSGALLLSNAEMLGGIVLAAALGCPQSHYAITPIVMDQHSGVGCYADPRKLAACAASMDLALFYGLDGASFHMGSDATVPGIQATAERLFGTLLSLFLADQKPRIRLGVLGPSGNSGSVVQMLIDAELCSMINAFLTGIDVDEDRLAFDLIRRVGIGGNYLMEDHTRRYYREEMWFPSLFQRCQPTIGIERQREEVYDKARRAAEQILGVPQNPAVNRDQADAIDAVLARAEREVPAGG